MRELLKRNGRQSRGGTRFTSKIIPHSVHGGSIDAAFVGDLHCRNTFGEEQAYPLLSSKTETLSSGLYCRVIWDGGEDRSKMVVEFSNGLMKPTKRLVRVAVQQLVTPERATMGYAQACEFVGVPVTNHIGQCISQSPEREIPELLIFLLLSNTAN